MLCEGIVGFYLKDKDVRKIHSPAPFANSTFSLETQYIVTTK